MEESGKQSYEKVLEDLEDDVGDIENSFDQVNQETEDPTIRQKQEKAQDILEEIHDQLEFLREQVEKE